MRIPYLSGLGISLIDQDRVPSQAAFPRKFNPYASALWSIVISQLKDANPQRAWAAAIQKYLDMCQAKNVYPFREQSGNNQSLLNHLKQCRDLLIKVFETVHPPLMSQYSVLQVQRSAELSAKGFTLSVVSTFTLDDPTFKQHLVNLGFQQQSNKLYKKLDVYTEVKFWFKNGKWYVEYSIQGPHIPEMLDKLPPKQRLEKFIIEDLWFPLTKSERPQHKGPRFI